MGIDWEADEARGLVFFIFVSPVPKQSLAKCRYSINIC